VRHSGVFWYRGSLSDVTATLRSDGDALTLEGSARVDSISVVEPAAMRASVLGPEFFDAERHPEITFASTRFEPGKVVGDLTIRGTTKEVTFDGTGPSQIVKGMRGESRVAASVSGKINRLDYGLKWNPTLEGGGVVLSNEVAITIDIEALQPPPAPPAPKP
jgi:polyisoprenoid-binding protein YceI